MSEANLKPGDKVRVTYLPDTPAIWVCPQGEKNLTIGSVLRVIENPFGGPLDPVKFPGADGDLKILLYATDFGWSCFPLDWVEPCGPEACHCDVWRGPCVCGAFRREMEEKYRVQAG